MDCSRPRTKDPREWLETCPDFSWPLVEQVHEWILSWEPDLTESIKWNMLCFTGRKLVCGLSGCQRHLGVTFFRGTELPDPTSLLSAAENNTHLRSLRVTTLDGFPHEAFRRLIRAAVALDAEALPPVPHRQREPWPVPDFFAAVLAQRKNRTAAENFQRLAPSCQREYLVWLSQAKRPETRARRLAETLAALAEGRKWAQRKLG
ncbi:MAG TPA: YdeI/OmpD-associated family protein [Verrucomicrobiota bacterium]|nr:hypothetical protein [Verrucomicrobiales bacterium]HRI12090.1 YdeI/OmpD-associated family protein [Verrucomicrobiota bacterium]